MIVICKKPTKKLVKDLRYETGGLYNSGKNSKWLEGTVDILGIGRFSVNNFTDIDGKPLPQIDIQIPRNPIKTLEFSEIKVGDILVCKSDGYKTFVKGGMYKVEKLDVKTYQVKSWSGQMVNRSENKIKFEGINRTLKFSGWRFRKLSADESRNFSLSSLLGEEGPKIINTSKLRKFDFVINKEKELMRIISKAILDESRHHLSIIDWACQKNAVNLTVTPKDFEQILELPLKDILEKLK